MVRDGLEIKILLTLEIIIYKLLLQSTSYSLKWDLVVILRAFLFWFNFF